MSESQRAVVTAAAGLHIEFQPIVNLTSGKLVGHEALARFRDGRPPLHWFDRAHHWGLGIDLEMLALSRALASVPLEGGGFVSLNLSPAALLSPMLPEVVKETAARVQLVLELTEHVPILDYEPVKCASRRLRDKGVLIAVDDLGNGFASMRHVLYLRPDIVKLDRSLVSSIDLDPVQHRLAANLVDFATSIDCDVIAEGIERMEEAATCNAIGITFGQGYYFGRPSPVPVRGRATSR